MVAEHGGPDPTTARGALQIQVSKLLLASTVAAIATSVAMIVAAVMIDQGPPPPPPGPGAQPPPLPVGPIVLMIVITGLFVVSWVAVIAVLARDQMLRRMRELDGADGARAGTQALLAALREDLAGLETRIAEYGEQRETDGYVNGMRVAARAEQPPAGVRPLHRIPPTA